MDPSYIINLLGETEHDYFGAVSPPIFSTSNFSFPDIDQMHLALANESRIPFYSRGVNPTVELLSQKLAALEKTEKALVFSSGSSAIAAAVMANCRQGDHIVCIDNPYSWTKYLLAEYLPRFGVAHTFVTGTAAADYQEALQSNTRLFILESPNSWTFETQDTEAIVSIAKKNNVLTLYDNSYNSPINFNPADYGIDLIAHSATKYISGHSDVVAGALCCSEAQYEKIFKSELMTIGSIAAPISAWLLLKGLRTLPIRMKAIAENTAEVLEYLQNHDLIQVVYHPFSTHNPNLSLAKKQLRQTGGLLSIDLATDDPEKVKSFCNSLTIFRLACSWGGYESLAFPAITLVSSENYHQAPHPINRIRLSIGLESSELLIRDLKTALEKIRS